MSLAIDYDPPSARDANNPAPRSSQNKSQLLEATMRNVPKLKELNYTQWKNVITNSIKKAKLWGYVDGSIEEPSEHDASNLTTYFDEAAAVRNAILGSLEYRAQKYIEEALDPKDAWLALEKKYLTAEGEVDSQLVSVQKQLADLRFEDGGDMAEHIAEFCRMRCQLNGSRFALDNQASVSTLYCSLPPNYRQLVLTSEGAEMKDFSALCARLSYISHSPELQARASGATSAPSQDYTHWGVPEEIRAFGLTGDKNPLLEERATITCRDCLLKDHEAGTPDCPQYEWRRELWGDSRRNTNQLGSTNEGIDNLEGNKRFIYEFSEPVKVVLHFGELNLKEHLIQSLTRFKLRAPQGIQQCAILPIVQGRNLIAQAPPETGKTTTIILSVIELTNTSKGEIQALILAPTEKKATDVHSMVNSLGYQCYISTTNQSTRDDLAQLAEGHNFSTLVGTPDRVLQLLRQGILVTSGIQILALDNLDISADNVLNPDILDIYQYLPRSVQTLSISSGSPNIIAKELVPYVNRPLYITISRYDTVFGGITHAFLVISNDSSNDKPFIIDQLINTGTPRARVGVLCDTFSEVEAVQCRLKHSSGCYYTRANFNSEERQKTINIFRHGLNFNHLVTTMSVPLKRMLGSWEGDSFWIVNYNPPSSPQNYLERIRYLGLCSGKNMAITLVNDGTDEVNTIREIERHFNIQMAKLSWNGSIFR
ncbi:ATP-dependent RNA helicase FAL1 [Cryptococcus neoformans var, neoformans B-3501A] [Rhizoctonia solani]|uniref:RNA helicase n=1 Tax=Rhizoctonia solani TaxID=456999 RepID=A0A0K6FNT3_9AGAM|nr:ATP-dependent RNA helicase FAL1 [Cryptococcus neoformans var, neoformans B-3501A] [Rhizoctonia solani]